MLKCLLNAINEMHESNPKSNQKKSNQKILSAISDNPNITIRELQDLLGLSESGVKKVISQLKNQGLLLQIWPKKGGHWEVRK